MDRHYNLKTISRRIIFLSGFFLAVILYFNLTSEKSSRSFTNADVVRIGMCALYKPYEFKDEKGAIVGFDVDFAEELAKRLGKELIIKDMEFASLILALKRGKIDCIVSGMSITKERMVEVDFVSYYGSQFKTFDLLFWKKIPKKFKKITRLDELEAANQTTKPIVAVQCGTVTDAYAQRFGAITPRTFDTIDELLLDVQYGKSASALVVPDITRQFEKDLGKNIKSVAIQLDSEDYIRGYGVAMQKNKPKLQKKINRIVTDLKEEGYFSWLERKWFKKKL